MLYTCSVVNLLLEMIILSYKREIERVLKNKLKSGEEWVPVSIVASEISNGCDIIDDALEDTVVALNGKGIMWDGKNFALGRGCKFYESIPGREYLYVGVAVRDVLASKECSYIENYNRLGSYLCESEDDAKMFASRHGSPYSIRVSVKKLLENGLKLYHGPRGIWYSKEMIPSCCIK